MIIPLELFRPRASYSQRTGARLLYPAHDAGLGLFPDVTGPNSRSARVSVEQRFNGEVGYLQYRAMAQAVRSATDMVAMAFELEDYGERESDDQ
jgi:hypothetical protein